MIINSDVLVSRELRNSYESCDYRRLHMRLQVLVLTVCLVFELMFSINFDTNAMQTNTKNPMTVNPPGCPFVLSSDDQLWVGIDYIYQYGVLTITSSSKITIANVRPSVPTAARITLMPYDESNHNVYVVLAGVNIVTADESALTCDYSCNAFITVKDGTTNTLNSSYTTGYSGLRIANASSLEIHGLGVLNVSGGDRAPGIGSCFGDECAYMFINECTIYALGGEGAAGIGCGSDSMCDCIHISGGTINASSIQGPGVGSAYNNINVIVVGGCIFGSIACGAYSHPMNELNESIYPTLLKLDGLTADTNVDDFVCSSKYGVTGVHTNAEGVLVFYLPKDTLSVAVVTTGGSCYVNTNGIIITMDTELTKGILTVDVDRCEF